MTWDSRVVWSEGMFILPQHFQQADRHVESLVRESTAPLRSFPWGVTALEIDRAQLALRKFAVTRCSGVLEDGTPFSIPDGAPPPPAIDLPDNTRDCIVYLTLPLRHEGSPEVVLNGTDQTPARYQALEREVADSVGEGTAARTPLHVGQLRLRYALETEPRADTTGLGLARIAEVRSEQVPVRLDDNHIPPCLTVAASPVLCRFLDELQGLLRQRATALAGRVSEAGTQGVAEFGDYLLLLTLNRYEPVVTHLAQTRAAHPEDFYRTCVQIAGELATLVSRSRRPPAFPPYRHDDLQSSFLPVMSELRHALTIDIGTAATKLNLTLTPSGIWFAAVTDRSLLGSCSFVLVVRAATSVETLRGTFPGQVKIGPVKQIRELVTAASRGILLRPLSVAPRQIPYQSGRVYFELERVGPQWEGMRASEGFAIHVAGDFPQIEMDLWAIREVAS